MNKNKCRNLEKKTKMSIKDRKIQWEDLFRCRIKSMGYVASEEKCCKKCPLEVLDTK